MNDDNEYTDGQDYPLRDRGLEAGTGWFSLAENGFTVRRYIKTNNAPIGSFSLQHGAFSHVVDFRSAGLFFKGENLRRARRRSPGYFYPFLRLSNVSAGIPLRNSIQVEASGMFAT